MLQKKIDSTTFFGKAEEYLNTTRDFNDFLRSKYKAKDIKSVDLDKVIKKFNLRGVIFGNYVTQVERYFFVFKLESQLEFLAKIRGNNNLGKGVLTIGFGANGRKGSLAHFNPSRNYINLNRGSKDRYDDVLQGENSFIHEYGHFIDFLQGRKDKKIPFNFASENSSVLGFSGLAASKYFSNFVAIALEDNKYMNGLSGRTNSKYLMSEIEVFARLFEHTVQLMAEQDKDYSIYFDKNFRSNIYLSKSKIEKSKAKELVKKMLKS